MVDIQSKEVIDKVSEDLKIQPAMQIPRELAKQIQLVYGVNPLREIQIANVSVSDATTGTILTTNSAKDTFLVGFLLTVAKSSLSPSAFSAIRFTVAGGVGGSANFMIRYEPLTAGQFTESLSLPLPIKLDRGSDITVTNSSATASIDATGIVYFYETDPQ